MATSNFQTHKPFPLLLTISLTFFFLLLNKVNSSEELSFKMTNFSSDEEHLMLQRDAVITPTGKLHLTKVVDGKPVYQSIGRALYSTPIRIWNSRTGAVASFSTSFNFRIYAPDQTKTADGLAFFLAPKDTEPGLGGGYLGIFSSSNYNSSNQIVAVELDTYYNAGWDPKNTPHIGINVNSIKSKKVASWGFRNGNVANVLITYDASTQLFVASLVYPSGKTSYIVSAAVDVKRTLPEWVRVGFSATTGAQDPSYVETHEILSWSFKSKLPSGDVCDEGYDPRFGNPVLDESMDLSAE